MAQGERQDDDKGLINLCGLWLQTSRAGRKYFAGRLGVGGKLMIFRNAKKKEAKDPDYYAVIGEWKQAEGGARAGRDAGEDDVPF
jgi:hypothetical protein